MIRKKNLNQVILKPDLELKESSGGRVPNYEISSCTLDSMFSLCTPNPFVQCVTLMMFDPRTKLYLTVFFSLMISRTRDSNKRLLHCIEFAVGSKPDINALVCDFESALIFAVREHFPESRIVGCLFHLKQAWRRKMKDLRLPNIEVSIAMQKGVLDMLTVVDPEKGEIKGVA
ncbi:Hypothetical protein PHPALM_6226 [Phytophthora palmivora]|uniref:MULE transposase domain-containing protein n=1 Tax=Phytophthora palmivora TaxID=4796 RepID=A0A2P4YFF6_9STRA|nr:Hypothetical protein PHPALM_6226 [Phytophthora palmivora]